LADNEQAKSFFETFQHSVLTSVPALSVLTFLLVAVKVFRVSGMEASTTVAIVSTANTAALLKGVVLTLLPGFIAAVIAAAVWRWAESLPVAGEGTGMTTAHEAGDLALAWAMVAAGFFTIPWPIFLAFFMPMLLASTPLVDRRLSSRKTQIVRIKCGFRILALGISAFSIAYGVAWASVGDTSSNWFWTILLVFFLGLFLLVYRPVNQTLDAWDAMHWRRARKILRVFGAGAAALMIGYLALSQTVWLPLRLIEVQPGKAIELNGQALPERFGAYVLTQDDKGASLLLETPRAVIQVGPKVIADNPQICIPEPSSFRRLFLRASQILHLESDPGSPYPVCPQA
jgi:hypothetical protein